MKRLSSIFLIMLILLIGCVPLAVSETVQQGGLIAVLNTVCSSYRSSETISATLSLHNTGVSPINDVTYELVSPAGYTVNGHVGPISVGTLAPGESLDQSLLLKPNQLSLPQTGDSSSLSGAMIVLGFSCALLALLVFDRRKHGRRLLSILLCTALLSSMFAGIPASSSAEFMSAQSMSITKMLSIDGEDTPLQIVITYTTATEVFCTRAEWIDRLISEAGILPVDLNGAVSYADIEGTPYQEQIETAIALGILTPASSEDCFYPNDPATRDFSAAMAIRTLRFIPNTSQILNVPDSSHIEYPTEAFLAIQQGMLSLENGYYIPRRPLSEAEASGILRIVEEVTLSTLVTEDGGQGITYMPGVENITASSWADDGNVLTLPQSKLPSNIKTGSIFVLNGNKAYHVTSISRANGQAYVRYTEPELNEVIAEIDAHGFLRGDINDFQPAEGVNVVAESAISTYGARIGNASSGLLGTLKLSGEKQLSNGSKFFYEVGISIPEASFNFDANLLTWQFRNVYASISPQIAAEFTWGGSGSNPETAPMPKQRFFLGSVPLFGIHGAGVLVEFYISCQAEGKFGVEIDLQSLMGIQIYNNCPRAFGDMNLEFVPKASGKISVGPNFYLVASLLGKNLLSFGGYLAGYLEGSAAWHVAANTCCIDGALGMLLEIDMGDCLIKKLPALKNQSLVWEILKHAFLRGHIEITGSGVQSVRECTLNRGTLRGIVAQATNRTAYIQGANITLISSDGQILTASSGSTGGYTLVTKEGDYVLKVSKSGYIPFESNITIIAGDTNIVETLLMVEGSENDSRTGTIGGVIKNAKTGSFLSNVRIDIRKGWNKTSGACIQTFHTDGNGKYQATLPLGNYTLALTKDGFVSTHINVAVAYNTDLSHHGTMMPEKNSPNDSTTDRLSIVLTWGETPRDLDSHLRGYSTQGNEMFHTFYNNNSYYVNSEKQAFLDLDDTSSYGPETTTIMGMRSGETYSFFVHDFTNRAYYSSKALANSGAKVTVYRGADLLREFFVPNQTGTVWHVFDYDVTHNVLIPVNTFTSTSNANQVGSRISSFGLRETISPDKE